MTVYLDLVIILNFLVDLLLILGTNSLTGYPMGIKRAVLGAALGALYAGMCMVSRLRFLGNPVWRIIFLGLMSGIAFGWNRAAVRRTAVFVLLTMAMGGLAVGVGLRDFLALCLCGILLYLLCRVGLPGGIGRRAYVDVLLQWQDRLVPVLALRDTGNTLQDPLTGEQVLVCGADVGEALLGISRRFFEDPVKIVSQGLVPGARLISYRCVGQPGAMMLLLRLKGVRIGHMTTDPLVAFAPQVIGEGEEYGMLTGGSLG